MHIGCTQTQNPLNFETLPLVCQEVSNQKTHMQAKGLSEHKDAPRHRLCIILCSTTRLDVVLSSKPGCLLHSRTKPLETWKPQQQKPQFAYVLYAISEYVSNLCQTSIQPVVARLKWRLCLQADSAS